MFATLRYSPQSNVAICVERTTQPPLQGQGHQHSACVNCRAKKLRCTGQKSGCDRYKTKTIACVYSASADNKGTKRRGRLQTSIDNTNLSSISSSLPTSTSKPTTSQPSEAPSPENAPITNEKRSTGPSEENLSAQSPDRSVAQDNEEPDSDSDSSFMNLLGTISMEVETTEPEFRFPSSIDVDDPSHGALLPDLSPFDPVVEDFLCFEPDIELIEKLGTADNVQRPLPQNISSHAADDTGDSTVRTPPSNTMLSASRWNILTRVLGDQDGRRSPSDFDLNAFDRDG